MYKRPEEIFTHCYPDYVYDIDKYKIIKQFRIAWTQKNDITLEFLASNFTGVYSVRFSAQDEEILFKNILDMDRDILQKEIYDLRGISKNMRTVSNATYVTLMWFAHKFLRSNFPKDIKEDAIKECYYIMAYKIVCSLTSHYFKYTVEIEVAKAINEHMTNKFLIKRLGSWQALFDYKTKDLLENGIHYKRLLQFDADDMIRIISDIETKLRDIFKNNYGQLAKVRKNQESIKDYSFIEKDNSGTDKIKDITSNTALVINKIKHLILSKVDFINYDLIGIICLKLKVINEADLQKILVHITELDTKVIGKYLDGMISNSLSYIASKGIFTNYRERVGDIINILLGYWKSGNIKDQFNKDVKRVFFEIAKDVCNKNTSTTFNLSVATIVYIITLCFI